MQTIKLFKKFLASDLMKCIVLPSFKNFQKLGCYSGAGHPHITHDGEVEVRECPPPLWDM
jgi:hypothetical protein